ncbi:cyclopropane-fatty-acyl-phospholipid synthase family protein [Thalassospira sp.]|uniref:SAM-dependent methyltransferase n=1 Tax=Thalassospira sp. TaxID=1912094 RepID=UPI0025D376E4|nr:cyclopropane-fatty-acyl-phospholipid synthase family protein [Thalassospira sp.]|tara:strand:+ start:5306 stop:6490 length:1185 start_codon:yes stop_codon:yes gene_type:complete
MSDRLAFATVSTIIKKFFRVGNVDLVYKDLSPVTVGDGSGEKFILRFNTRSALTGILYRPSLNIGEIFMDQGWDLVQGDLGHFMGLLLKNEELLEETFVFKSFDAISSALGHWLTVNSVDRSHQNVEHHYDLGNDLYTAFLDDKMLYSCAFFDEGITSLEEAQANKLRTTIDRLKMEPGMKVLEVGCGWGAMSHAIAENGGEATGITLSREQLEFAKSHTPKGVRDRARFILQDYRDHARENAGTYDRIVSIGMFEHVGRRHYKEYFDAVYSSLKPGGRAVIHSIVKDTTTRTNPWLRKYIFPGGQAPRIVDMTDAAKAAGLTVPHAPFEHVGHNYAETLRHWRKRFNDAYPSLDHDRYDERFRRMWLFYLSGSEASFDALGTRVAQVVVEKPL